jgi:hypothetical protein
MVYKYNKSPKYFEDLETNYFLKPEVEERDYKPYITKTGYLDEKTIPVYGYLKFAFTLWNVPFHMFVDNKGREILLLPGSEGNPNTNSYFKAYRYAPSETFIFENTPLKPPFLLNNQFIDYIDYACSDYIVASIKTINNDNSASYNFWLIKTNADYNEMTWQLKQNLTAKIGFNLLTPLSQELSQALFLTQLQSCCVDVNYNKLYVVKCVDAAENLTGWGKIKLYMYDLNTLDFINSYEIFDMNVDVDINAYYGIDSKGLAYRGLGCAFNYNTGELLIHLQCIIYFWIQPNLRTLSVKSFVISIKLDDIMRNNGTVSYSYLIPRDISEYNFFNSTNCKGISTFYGSNTYSLSFDKYNNVLYIPHIGMHGGLPVRISSFYFNNINDANTMVRVYPDQTRDVIDSCPYAKQNYRAGFFIDDYIITAGKSQKYGNSVMYISKINMLDDKVDLLPGQWRILTQINPDSRIPIHDRGKWFIYKSGSNVSHYIYDSNFKVYKINIGSNFNISYTDMNITLPVPPSSLYIRRDAWGYDFNTNTVYWICTDVNDYGRSVVVWTSDNGATWNKSPRISASEANTSATSYGDGVARYVRSINGFIENGIFYSGSVFGTVGGEAGTHIDSYDKNTNTITQHNIFLGPWFDMQGRFGWHPIYGYYAGVSYESWRQRFYFNQNLQDFLNNVNQTSRYIYTVPSSGLAATVVNFPIYMDGRLYYLPNEDVALNPNTDNYIYAILNNNNISLYVDTVKLSNTAQRILLAKITTNATDPISQELYEVRELSLPDYYNHKKIMLKNISIPANGEITYNNIQLDITNFDNIIYSIYRQDGLNYYLDNTFTVSKSSDLTKLYIKSNYSTTQNISLIIIGD